ncbi:MAG: hypothetical protein ACK41T_09805 [Pseudobdellovibrio sp.]
MNRKTLIYFTTLATAAFLFTSCGQQKFSQEQLNQIDIAAQDDHSDHILDDHESDFTSDLMALGCKKATQAQLNQVNLGYTKLDQFLKECVKQTGSDKWCKQVARPNPNSYSTFSCTYSPSQPHNLIHPTESTWAYAIQAVKLVQDLEKNGVGIDIIYNWWRPEPYNANVGGAAGRHPFGTSVDVRFINKTQQNKAHTLLCKYRKQGRLRALGYYSGTGLHLGVGDKTANTWGKACN